MEKQNSTNKKIQVYVAVVAILALLAMLFKTSKEAEATSNSQIRSNNEMMLVLETNTKKMEDLESQIACQSGKVLLTESGSCIIDVEAIAQPAMARNFLEKCITKYSETH